MLSIEVKKSLIKKIYDAIKEKRLLYSIQHKLVSSLDFDINYLIKTILNKPYLGKLYYSDQLGNLRKKAIIKLLNNNKVLKKNFLMLEIGAWAGSSTLLFADQLRKVNGKIITVDIWDNYTEIEGSEYPKNHNRQKMKEANIDDKMYKIFIHNIKSSGYKNISFLRMKSDQALKLFSDKSFDLIYIDGDHSYEAVKKDIVYAKKKIKKNGIICGDDLEIEYKNIDKKFTDKKSRFYLNPKEIDYSRLNNGKSIDHDTGCHLGVSFAVHEEFRKVNMKNGFWFYSENQNLKI
jgi:predicted O-methyltransferase YrrM